MSTHPSLAQLSALIDGDLSLNAREAVTAHLRECSACAAQQEELVEIAATLATVPPERWSHAMTAAVLERVSVEPQEQPLRVRGRDWSLAISSALALVGVAAIALVAPFPAAALFDGMRLNIFAAFAEGAGLPFTAFLAVLVLLPVLGLLAVPLLRER